MDVSLLAMAGLDEALLGLGLSYGLTSGVESAGTEGFARLRSRLETVAARLAGRGNGEDKWMRQVMCWWSITAPRYWWIEMDQYRVGVVTQSESTMHTLESTPITAGSFAWPRPPAEAIDACERLRRDILQARERRDYANISWHRLVAALPQSYLQRRVVSLSLAAMANICRQRRGHRLREWQEVADAFIRATPAFARRALYGDDDIQAAGATI